MTPTPDLTGYVDVATRIAEFRTRHPDGCLRPVDAAQTFRIVEIGADRFVVVAAAAYRTPHDPLPGIGQAWEPYPGRTPYTRGSELQNAETSAWGRAIVAALVADTRAGVASADEVRNRVADRAAEEHTGAHTAAATTRATPTPVRGRRAPAKRTAPKTPAPPEDAVDDDTPGDPAHQQSVTSQAAAAGVDEAVLDRQIAARHDGRALAQLTRGELRGEWQRYHQDATATPSTQEPA